VTELLYLDMFGAARWPVGEDFHVGLAGRQPDFGLETHVGLACRRPTRGAANEQQWHQQQNPIGHAAMILGAACL
jgi:hypothetical protein